MRGRQRGPGNLVLRHSVLIKNLRPALSTKFGDMSDRTQPRPLPRYQNEEIKILNILFPRVGMKSTTFRVYSRTRVPHAPRLASLFQDLVRRDSIKLECN